MHAIKQIETMEIITNSLLYILGELIATHTIPQNRIIIENSQYGKEYLAIMDKFLTRYNETKTNWDIFQKELK